MFNNPSSEEMQNILGISADVVIGYRGLVAGAYELYETSNVNMPEARQTSRETISEIISREGGDTPQAAKAIIDFVSTVENPATKTPTVHIDLLPSGHPLVAASRADVANYYGSDPSLDSKVQGLIACAIAAAPESATRKFFVEQLTAAGHEMDALRLVEDADRILSQS